LESKPGFEELFAFVERSCASFILVEVSPHEENSCGSSGSFGVLRRTTGSCRDPFRNTVAFPVPCLDSFRPLRPRIPRQLRPTKSGTLESLERSRHRRSRRCLLRLKPKRYRTVRSKLVKLHSAASARLPDFVEPMQAKLVDSMRPGDWIYEIKFDGYRALALCGGSEARIPSRTNGIWGANFQKLKIRGSVVLKIPRAPYIAAHRRLGIQFRGLKISWARFLVRRRSRYLSRATEDKGQDLRL